MDRDPPRRTLRQVPDIALVRGNRNDLSPCLEHRTARRGDAEVLDLLGSPNLSESRKYQNFGISPTGARAVFEAWGEIFTFHDKGDIRNLTHSPAVADRDPSWSPDGKSIAYFSDESGEYELAFAIRTVWEPLGTSTSAIRRHSSTRQSGLPIARRSPIPTSDCSCGISISISHAQAGRCRLLRRLRPDPAQTRPGLPTTNGSPTPSSFPADMHAVFVYSLEQSKSFQVTDGMSDASYPSFDKNGKYLYFTASTEHRAYHGGLDMSSDEHRVTRSVYVAVLSKDENSPLAPESDEEKPKDEKKADQDKDKDKDQPADKDKSKDKDKSRADKTADDKNPMTKTKTKRQERRAGRREDRH